MIDWEEKRICPNCHREVTRGDMEWTYDCHGIPYQLVCFDCYERMMKDGYAGEYYDELDEQIEDDY